MFTFTSRCNIFDHFGYLTLGPRTRIEFVAHNNRHNRSIGEKIAELKDKENYEGFRNIRGDGNCYFRAVAFGLLEYLVLSGRRDQFLKLHEKFVGIRKYLETETDQSAHDSLLEKLLNVQLKSNLCFKMK